ncbi:MAG: DUF4124 domain-containing protein [Algiphilus sp.]
MLAAVGTATELTAGIYRWTDTEGQLHFGDRPPPGVQAERLQPGSRLGEIPPAASSRASQPQQQAAAEPQPPLRDRDIPSCDQARETLTGYQSASRIIETDLLGEERELNEAQRGRLIARQERIVERACAE